MGVLRVEVAFKILKEIKREITKWENGGLDEIKDEEVYSIINLLRIFLELKGGVRWEEFAH